MKNSQHTPGPWHADFDLGLPGIVAAGREGNEICIITAKHYEPNDVGELFPVLSEEDNANARLIAAAPDLLACLKWAVKNLDTRASMFGKGKSLEAIAKATQNQ